jgi:hypothetical protein
MYYIVFNPKVNKVVNIFNTKGMMVGMLTIKTAIEFIPQDNWIVNTIEQVNKIRALNNMEIVVL